MYQVIHKEQYKLTISNAYILSFLENKQNKIRDKKIQNIENEQNKNFRFRGGRDIPVKIKP